MEPIIIAVGIYNFDSIEQNEHVAMASHAHPCATAIVPIIRLKGHVKLSMESMQLLQTAFFYIDIMSAALILLVV